MHSDQQKVNINVKIPAEGPKSRNTYDVVMSRESTHSKAHFKCFSLSNKVSTILMLQKFSLL